MRFLLNILLLSSMSIMPKAEASFARYEDCIFDEQCESGKCNRNTYTCDIRGYGGGLMHNCFTDDHCDGDLVCSGKVCKKPTFASCNPNTSYVCNGDPTCLPWASMCYSCPQGQMDGCTDSGDCETSEYCSPCGECVTKVARYEECYDDSWCADDNYCNHNTKTCDTRGYGGGLMHNCFMDDHCDGDLVCSGKVCKKPLGSSCSANKAYMCISNNCNELLETCTPTLPSTTCSLEPARDVQVFLQTLVANSEECSDNIGPMKTGVSAAKSFAYLGKSFTSIADNVVDAIDEVVTLADQLGSAINAIPKVGPVINKIVEILKVAKPGVAKIGDLHPTFEAAHSRLDDLDYVLTVFKLRMGIVTGYAGGSAYALYSAITSSMENSCCSADEINWFAETYFQINEPVAWKPLSKSASLCASFDIDLELLEIDTGLLTEIEALIREIKEWIQTVVSAVEGAVEYVSCCNPTVSFFIQLMELPNDVLDLASCWLTSALASGFSETLDVLLAQLEPAVDKVDEDIEKVNDLISGINNILGGIQGTVYNLPGIELSSQCGVTLSIGGDTVQIEQFSDLDHIDAIDLNADGTFDLDQIGRDIKDECDLALDALTSSDSVDCCPSARIKEGINPAGKSNGSACAGSWECKSGWCPSVCVGICPVCVCGGVCTSL